MSNVVRIGRPPVHEVRAMQSARRSLPDWLLERLAAGDLPPARATQARNHLWATGEAGRLRGLEASNLALLAAHPPAEVAREVHRRRQTPPRRWSLALARPALAAGLAALALLAAPGGGGQSDTREKGIGAGVAFEPALAVYRKGDLPLRPLVAGSAVLPGEVIQVEYLSAGRRYGVVASVDARGQVTLHLPEQPGPAPALDGQGAHPVPSALELDDSPGFERFVFVTADIPFSTGVVVEALRHGSFPAGLDVREVVLRKPPR
jgi:hypothetical protein